MLSSHASQPRGGRAAMSSYARDSAPIDTILRVQADYPADIVPGLTTVVCMQCLEYQVPRYQKRTQPARRVKRQPCRARPLRRLLELPVTPLDILRRRQRLRHQHVNLLRLRRQVADERRLQVANLGEGSLGGSGSVSKRAQDSKAKRKQGTSRESNRTGPTY